jgi:hypothetical protein
MSQIRHYGLRPLFFGGLTSRDAACIPDPENVGRRRLLRQSLTEPPSDGAAREGLEGAVWHHFQVVRIWAPALRFVVLLGATAQYSKTLVGHIHRRMPQVRCRARRADGRPGSAEALVGTCPDCAPWNEAPLDGSAPRGPWVRMSRRAISRARDVLAAPASHPHNRCSRCTGQYGMLAIAANRQ